MPHPDKTHERNREKRGQGFEFQGHGFEAGKRRARKKSLAKIKKRIRALTRRNGGKSSGQMTRSLNRTLTGP
jgi:hypothetical protein